MANFAAPRGLSPVGTITGAAYNEQGRLYAISSTDTTNSYAIGDVVVSADGTDANGVPQVVKYTGTGVPLGIVVGIRVADPGTSLQGTTLALNQTYLTAGSAAGRYVFVVDDPNVIFQVQFDATGVTQAQGHLNAALSVTAAQSLTMSSPLSSVVATAPATTNTLPIRLLGLAQIPGNGFGGYAVALAKFNIHEFGVGTGTNFTAV